MSREPERIRVLPYGRRRPRRGPTCWCIYIRRTGRGAGKDHSILPLPPDLRWPEVSAVRRWMRTQPADTSLAALQTGAARVYGPLVVRRVALADGASPEQAEALASKCHVPEWGEAPPWHVEGGRLTRVRPTGRWIGPDGKPFHANIPADADLPAGVLVGLHPVAGGPVQ